MNPTQTAPLEPGYRIQLPADWAEALGLRGQVVLHKCPEGILIRPGPRYTWDEIFATKLVVNSATPGPDNDDLELSRDDLLF